jgi:hypothetical protein
MIMAIETKQAREGNEIHLVVLTLCGLVNDVNSTIGVLLMVIGSIKLQNNLIVPMLPELHQGNEIHVAQIYHHLL